MKKILSMAASAVLLAGVVVFSPSVSALNLNVHNGVNQVGKEANQLFHDLAPNRTDKENEKLANGTNYVAETAKTECAADEVYDVIAVYHGFFAKSGNSGEYVGSSSRKIVAKIESCSKDFATDRAKIVEALGGGKFTFIEDSEEYQKTDPGCTQIFNYYDDRQVLVHEVDIEDED